MSPEPMTPHMAKTVLTALVAHAGYRTDGRDFLHHQTTRYCPEYRFQGALGFGGKLWRDHHGRLAVDCYREDETPERLAVIEQTNAVLAAIVGQEG